MIRFVENTEKWSASDFEQWAGDVIGRGGDRRHPLVARIQNFVRRYPAFSPSDSHDVLQEVLLQLHRCQPKYDARKASIRTFYDRVSRNVIASQLRRRTAQKRHPGRPILSLNESIPGDDGERQRVDCLCESARMARSQQQPHDEARERELRLDLASVMESVTPELRALARAIMEGAPISAAPETEAQIAALRQCFEEAELHAYLKS